MHTKSNEVYSSQAVATREAVEPLSEHQWLMIAKLIGIATQTVLQARAAAKSNVVYISRPAAAHQSGWAAEGTSMADDCNAKRYSRSNCVAKAGDRCSLRHHLITPPASPANLAQARQWHCALGNLSGLEYTPVNNIVLTSPMHQ
jgi:hypothetical protein